MAGDPWTRERFLEARAILAKHTSVQSAADELGIHPSRLRHAFMQVGDKPSNHTKRPEQAPAGPPPPPPDPLEVYTNRSRLNILNAERSELLQRLSDSERRLRFWADLKASPVPPDVPRREFGSGVREGTAVALLSDCHIEEYVDPAKVADRNSYNLKISAHRMNRFFQGTKWLIEFQRQEWAVRDLILWLGGDLMTGFIHDELIESNELSPTETVIELRRRLRSGINLLLEDGELEQIIIPCSYGNHGRIGQKRRVKTGAENSYEWMLYNLMAEDYENEPRVRFEVPRGAHTYVTAYDKTLHFHHGDEVYYWGGVGGLHIPLGKRVPMWENVKHADIHHIGHFHQLTDVGHTVVNGSLIGYTEYAFSIGAAYEPPRQAFYLYDSKRGKCNVTPIWVDD